MRLLIPLLVAVAVGSCAPAVSAPEPTADGAAVPADAPGLDITPSTPPTAIALSTPGATPTRNGASGPGGRVGSANADFDCDGAADRLQFSARAAPVPGDANTIARLELATGAVHELMLVAYVEGAPLIGTADVNGDGCADAIVTLDRGASTTQATFLVYDRGELRRVQESGRPATFLFGGSVRHGNAIECRQTKGAAEIVARATSDYTSDFQWDAVEEVHRWSTRSELMLWSTTPSVITVSVRYALPPDQDRYWGLSCGNVNVGH